MIWKLEPIDPDYPGDAWDYHGGYDCAHGFVVRAATEAEARQIVVDTREGTPSSAFPDGWPVTGSEGPDVWLDPTATSCTPIDVDGEPAVLLRDFLRG